MPTRPTLAINYACGRCASGTFAADMSRPEAIKHAAMMHNRVVISRKTGLLAVIYK